MKANLFILFLIFLSISFVKLEETAEKTTEPEENVNMEDVGDMMEKMGNMTKDELKESISGGMTKEEEEQMVIDTIKQTLDSMGIKGDSKIDREYFKKLLLKIITQGGDGPTDIESMPEKDRVFFDKIVNRIAEQAPEEFMVADIVKYISSDRIQEALNDVLKSEGMGDINDLMASMGGQMGAEGMEGMEEEGVDMEGDAEESQEEEIDAAQEEQKGDL